MHEMVSLRYMSYLTTRKLISCKGGGVRRGVGTNGSARTLPIGPTPTCPWCESAGAASSPSDGTSDLETATATAGRLLSGVGADASPDISWESP